MKYGCANATVTGMGKKAWAKRQTRIYNVAATCGDMCRTRSKNLAARKQEKCIENNKDRKCPYFAHNSPTLYCCFWGNICSIKCLKRMLDLESISPGDGSGGIDQRVHLLFNRAEGANVAKKWFKNQEPYSVDEDEAEKRWKEMNIKWWRTGHAAGSFQHLATKKMFRCCLWPNEIFRMRKRRPWSLCVTFGALDFVTPSVTCKRAVSKGWVENLDVQLDVQMCDLDWSCMLMFDYGIGLIIRSGSSGSFPFFQNEVYWHIAHMPSIKKVTGRSRLPGNWLLLPGGGGPAGACSFILQELIKVSVTRIDCLILFA